MDQQVFPSRGYGTVTAGGYGYGSQGYAPSGTQAYDSWSIQYGDEDDPVMVGYANPGAVNLGQANPELWKIIQQKRFLTDRFRDFAGSYTDPARYAARREDMLQRADVGATNRANRMGLGASSAGMGFANEAVRNAGFAADDHQIQDMMRLSQMEASLLGDVEATTLRAQAGYADFQKTKLNAAMQARSENMAADAADSAIWSSIIGGLGTIGGAIIGGPAGAAVGGSIGSNVGGSMMSAPTSSPNGFTLDPGLYDPNWYNSAASYSYDAAYSPGYFG